MEDGQIIAAEAAAGHVHPESLFSFSSPAPTSPTLPAAAGHQPNLDTSSNSVAIDGGQRIQSVTAAQALDECENALADIGEAYGIDSSPPLPHPSPPPTQQRKVWSSIAASSFDQSQSSQSQLLPPPPVIRGGGGSSKKIKTPTAVALSSDVDASLLIEQDDQSMFYADAQQSMILNATSVAVGDSPVVTTPHDTTTNTTTSQHSLTMGHPPPTPMTSCSPIPLLSLNISSSKDDRSILDKSNHRQHKIRMRSSKQPTIHPQGIDPSTGEAITGAGGGVRYAERRMEEDARLIEEYLNEHREGDGDGDDDDDDAVSNDDDVDDDGKLSDALQSEHQHQSQQQLFEEDDELPPAETCTATTHDALDVTTLSMSHLHQLLLNKRQTAVTRQQDQQHAASSSTSIYARRHLQTSTASKSRASLQLASYKANKLTSALLTQISKHRWYNEPFFNKGNFEPSSKLVGGVETVEDDDEDEESTNDDGQQPSPSKRSKKKKKKKQQESKPQPPESQHPAACKGSYSQSYLWRQSIIEKNRLLNEKALSSDVIHSRSVGSNHLHGFCTCRDGHLIHRDSQLFGLAGFQVGCEEVKVKASKRRSNRSMNSRSLPTEGSSKVVDMNVKLNGDRMKQRRTNKPDKKHKDDQKDIIDNTMKKKREGRGVSPPVDMKEDMNSAEKEIGKKKRIKKMRKVEYDKQGRRVQRTVKKKGLKGTAVDMIKEVVETSRNPSLSPKRRTFRKSIETTLSSSDYNDYDSETTPRYMMPTVESQSRNIPSHKYENTAHLTIGTKGLEGTLEPKWSPKRGGGRGSRTPSRTPLRSPERGSTMVGGSSCSTPVKGATTPKSIPALDLSGGEGIGELEEKKDEEEAMMHGVPIIRLELSHFPLDGFGGNLRKI
jgi:hypothetical protein